MKELINKLPTIILLIVGCIGYTSDPTFIPKGIYLATALISTATLSR